MKQKHTIHANKHK